MRYLSPVSGRNNKQVDGVARYGDDGWRCHQPTDAFAPRRILIVQVHKRLVFHHREDKHTLSNITIIDVKNSLKHRVTVTKFCSISMPAGFRRHFVGKTLICFLLWYRLNTLCWSVNDHRDVALDHLIQFYLNNALNLRPLTPHIMLCYSH